MKYQTMRMINKITPYLDRGESYTVTMRAIRSEKRMCENTFMKYWKIARQYNWEHWRYINKMVEEMRKTTNQK
jgi:hypothetical protein